MVPGIEGESEVDEDDVNLGCWQPNPLCGIDISGHHIPFNKLYPVY
ncbi:hypothetical protein COLO4_35904 [Corchorus olitorius]|uniref:Uncharacterized protein n=1 Tax=Corchorus olitorius TaxID=93759 RepID=A0A1R3GC19_9ROSI|nr:hypothetical protein COLO4_35904 [Corchorus olitorius]